MEPAPDVYSTKFNVHFYTIIAEHFTGNIMLWSFPEYFNFLCSKFISYEIFQWLLKLFLHSLLFAFLYR